MLTVIETVKVQGGGFIDLERAYQELVQWYEVSLGGVKDANL